MVAVVLGAVLLAGPLGLEDALARSDEAPEVSAAQRAWRQRLTSVDSISSLSQNPMLTLLPAVRTEGGVPRLEGQVSLQQSFALEPLQASRRAAVTQDAAQARALALEHAWARRSGVGRAWLDSWAARATTLAAKLEAEAAAQLVSRFEKVAGSGAVLRAELESSKAFAAEAETQVLLWEGREFESSAELAMLLGSDELPTVADDPPELPEPSLEVAPGFTRHPHLRLLEAQRAGAEARAKEAAALWGPSVHLALSGGYEAQAQWLAGLGVGLSLPLFERGQVEVSAQHSLLTRLEGERTSALRRAAIELKTLRHELEHTREVEAVVRERQLPASREALRLEVRRFEQGEATLQELLLVRRQAFAAEAAALASHADLLAARLRAREYLKVIEESP